MPSSPTSDAMDRQIERETDINDSQGESFISLTFQEDPRGLGMSLARRKDGKIYVRSVIADSQAADMDIEINDTLFKIGKHEIGEYELDKAAWTSLVNYIKVAPRPLHVVLKRIHKDDVDVDADVDADVEDSRSHHSGDNRHMTASKPTSPINTNVESIHTVNTTESQTYASANNTDTVELDGSAKQTEADMQQLKKIVSKLYIKEKEATTPLKSVLSLPFNIKGTHANSSSSGGSSSSCHPLYLISYNRKLLRTGELRVVVKGALWNVPVNRMFFLFNDYLLITIANTTTGNEGTNVIDMSIELFTCKLHNDVINSSSNDTVGSKDIMNGLSFDLISPAHGTINIVAGSSEDKQAWLAAIFFAMCSDVGEEEKVLG